MRAKLTFGATVIVLVYVCFQAYEEWKDVQRTSVYSCAASIGGAIQALDAPITEVKLKRDWYRLSPAEVRALSSRLRPADCAPGPEFKDQWGASFEILVREPSPGQRNLLIWSFGADHKPNTEDDVIAPSGEIPPKILQ